MAQVTQQPSSGDSAPPAVPSTPPPEKDKRKLPRGDHKGTPSGVRTK